jgi:hypothetical protein
MEGRRGPSGRGREAGWKIQLIASIDVKVGDGG